jgi:hypothetical protein
MVLMFIDSKKKGALSTNPRLLNNEDVDESGLHAKEIRAHMGLQAHRSISSMIRTPYRGQDLAAVFGCDKAIVDRRTSLADVPIFGVGGLL